MKVKEGVIALISNAGKLEIDEEKAEILNDFFPLNLQWQLSSHTRVDRQQGGNWEAKCFH